MVLRIPIPFSKQTPDQALRKVSRLNIQLKELGLPRVIMESSGDTFYTYDTGIFAKGLLDLTTPQGQADAYNSCAPLNAVVNRWLRAASNARWMIVDQDDQEITNPKGDLPTLMLKPNVLQTWNEFTLQVRAMQRVHGQAYIYKVRGVGIKEISALWVIPNYMIREILTGLFLMQTDITKIVDHYEFTFNGQFTTIPLTDIIKIKDSSVNFFAGVISTTSQGNNITDSQSRLYAMGDVINSLIAAYQAKKNTIIKRGPLGILGADRGTNTVTSVPMRTEDEKKLHDKIEQAYGVGDGQRQEIITKEALKWTQITKGIKDLMLFEEVEAGTREICTVMDYPFELLGYTSGSSLAGGGKFLELKKMLYTDSIIPESESLGATLTNIFLPSGQFLKPFFDHMDFYQRSRLDDAKAMQAYNDACKVAVDAGAMDLETWKTGLLNYL